MSESRASSRQPPLRLSPLPETGPDPARYREVIGRFATGVTVVTTFSREPYGALDGLAPSPKVVGPELHPWGTTVNAFSGLSLDPPLVLICIGRGRKIHPVIAAAGRFAINILGEDSQDLADCFAGAPSSYPRSAFCNAPYRVGLTGVPLLEAAIAHLECTLERSIDAGDHTIYIGRVVDVGGGDDDALPLLYFRQHYLRIERAASADLLGIPDD
jgi:flavin reductase (DIM6/NTAB) family NADH-FMN oxidoreductase RutF